MDYARKYICIFFKRKIMFVGMQMFIKNASIEFGSVCLRANITAATALLKETSLGYRFKVLGYNIYI